MAHYKEAALVQKGPARDAFVAAVSQRLVDRLQDCRQFIRGEKAEVSAETRGNFKFTATAIGLPSNTLGGTADLRE
jgi:hypothetical protein